MIENPSAAAQLQARCIDIKVTVFDPPSRLCSPLEAYACIGKLYKQYGLELRIPEKEETLSVTIEKLKEQIDQMNSPSEKAEKMIQILYHFIDEEETKVNDVDLEILEYSYESERG